MQQAFEFDRSDPTHLRDHLRQCAFACGPLHRILCTLETFDAFLARRFVTTLTLIAAVLYVGISLPV